ncbi:MAG: cohesin domain-containing protein, partial [Clostridium sp.]
MKFSQKLKRVAGALSLLMVFQVAFSQMIPTKSASAAGEQVTYKLISGDPTKVGGTIEIGVNASGVAGVYGSSVDFKYDPSVIEVTEINKGTAFGSSAVQVPVKEIKNGVASLGVTLTGTSSNGVTLNGTLAV